MAADIDQPGENLKRTIAAACAKLDAQLVISLGGGATPDQLGITLEAPPVAAEWAAVRDRLKRACNG